MLHCAAAVYFLAAALHCRDKRCGLNTGKYTCLEIFARGAGAEGRVRVVSEKYGREEKEAGNGYYTWLKFSLEPWEDYEISCESCEVSFCYLSGNRDILETGVLFLERDGESGVFAAACQAGWYDHPLREAYHFSPWKNWSNDPNGLCWFQGYYHMFYQQNPHGQEWSDMYWGHAVSRDLVHWRHLPIALAPGQEILESGGELIGGAFSGCAAAREDEVVFYLTRHREASRGDGEMVEQQWMTRSRDMVHFTEEKCVIAQKPAGASCDFRDPKVLEIGDTWYMVLGSALDGRGAILLYESEDMENWRYVHPLLVEEKADIRCFECPDFMELDGKYLAIGAFMGHEDACGRHQMSRYYVGSWKDKRLAVESEGWFDFGSNCYAMQSFAHQGRRICIGWVFDLYGEHIVYENGACGSMTVPRELHIKNGRLYMTPVEEIRWLEGETIYWGGGENAEVRHIKGNAYRAEITCRENVFFDILLGEDEGKSISLVNDREGLRIVTKGVKSEGICFRADVEQVRKLEIFMDRRMVEVYVNDGEAAGTKIFYNTSEEGCFVLRAKEPENIEGVCIGLMGSIWGE